jgi:signal peptidase I
MDNNNSNNIENSNSNNIENDTSNVIENDDSNSIENDASNVLENDDSNNIENDASDNLENKIKIDYKEILSWIAYLGSAVLIALFLTNFVIINAYIPTGSMEDTIKPKDRVIASRIHYLFAKPQRGDIVVFKYPDNEKVNYVKRIIGLPGETVEIKDGEVFIDGVKLEEPYLKEEMRIEEPKTFIVPEDSYFVMGDNRNDSKDSRYWVTTNYVSKDKILGKVAFEYFPRPKWLW